MRTKQLPCIVCGQMTKQEEAVCENCRPAPSDNKRGKRRGSKSNGKIVLDLSNHKKLLTVLYELSEECNQPLENQIILLVLQGLVGFSIPEWNIEPIVKEIINNGKKNSVN